MKDTNGGGSYSGVTFRGGGVVSRGKCWGEGVNVLGEKAILYHVMSGVVVIQE